MGCRATTAPLHPSPPHPKLASAQDYLLELNKSSGLAPECWNHSLALSYPEVQDSDNLSPRN
jgi:hypothetical protein